MPAQIAGKRWKVDLNARQDVALQLSSVDLPGGAQVPALCGFLHVCCSYHVAACRHSTFDYGDQVYKVW